MTPSEATQLQSHLNKRLKHNIRQTPRRELEEMALRHPEWLGLISEELARREGLRYHYALTRQNHS